MNSSKKVMRLAIFPALIAFGMASASAQTLTIADVNGQRSSLVAVGVTYTDGAPDAASYNTEIAYDQTILSGDPTITAGAAGCTVDNVAHTISIIRVTFPAAAIPSETACTINFPIAADAPFAVYPLVHTDAATEFGDLDGVAIPTGTVEDGSITISDAPPAPPAVTFAPSGGAIGLTAPGGTTVGQQSTASVIAVTAVGGTGAGSGSYTCTQPGGPFTITNPSNPNILVGSDPADISVQCTLGLAVQNGNFSCTRTGALATPVNYTVSCPAGIAVPIAIFASTPAPGTQLNCNGQPNSATQTQVTIRNVGSPGVGSELNYTCTTASPGFSVVTNGVGVVAVGASSIVTVGCTVPAENAPAATGTLNCTSNAANQPAADYPLSAAAVVAPLVVPPNFVPASSLWSQLSLIGILAALGLLVVGIRRR